MHLQEARLSGMATIIPPNARNHFSEDLNSKIPPEEGSAFDGQYSLKFPTSPNPRSAPAGDVQGWDSCKKFHLSLT